MIALIISIFALLVLAILLFPVNISFNSVRSEGTINGSLGVSWIIFLFIYSLKEKELKIHIFGRSISRHISPEKRPKVPELEKEKNCPDTCSINTSCGKIYHQPSGLEIGVANNKRMIVHNNLQNIYQDCK